MLNTAVHLVKEALEIYRRDGAMRLFTKFVNYISFRADIDKKLLFNPLIPPISFSYGGNTIDLGYRDTYIYNCKSVNIPNVVPERSDTVIEAGVNIGRDTAMYAKLANRVVAFEPSPRNFSVAKKNLDRFDNIYLVNEGLWKQEGELEIKYGKTGSEDGFLEPDSGTESTGGNIPVNTLERSVDRLDIEEVNFLKIEAEGAEPEIIKGMGNLRPEKIVVNADEERGGNPTGKEVMELLKPMGYNLAGIKKGHMLFFVLKSGGNYAFGPEFNSKN